MSKIIVIDPGHGGSDPGAQGNGLREKDLTLDISKRIKKYLDNNYTGLRVLMTRTGDKYLTLSQRAQFANRNKADLFISIHINAGGGTGYESFIHTSQNSNTATGKMQNTVHNEAMKKMKVTDRGKKKANFAVLRETNMRAILPENLFIDRKEDAAKLKKSSELQKIAEGHAIGIAKSLGLKGKKGGGASQSKPSKPSEPKKESSNTNNNKNLGLVDWMKSQKMDSSYNNRKKLAAQYGINNYSGTASQNNTLLSKLKGGKPETEKSSKNLKVDGYMGKLTISALQRYFGTVVDGYLSRPSLVIRKLQALLGEEEDGYLGPITIKALQKRFGTVQDGVISKPSLVIKELQRRLNKGKL